jgi:Na+/H+-translocating membrane pyrophosphatase
VDHAAAHGNRSYERDSRIDSCGCRNLPRGQYRSIGVIAAIFAAIFAVAIRDHGNPYLRVETAGGLILGVLCSILAVYVAMYVSVRSNVTLALAPLFIIVCTHRDLN